MLSDSISFIELYFNTKERKCQDALHSLLLYRQSPRLKSLHTFSLLLKYNRTLAIEVEGGLLWFWIGNHSDYDKLIK